METVWWLFGLLGWVIAIFLALALMHMSGRQDRIARDVEMRTQPGRGQKLLDDPDTESEPMSRRPVGRAEDY